METSPTIGLSLSLLDIIQNFNPLNGNESEIENCINQLVTEDFVFNTNVLPPSESFVHPPTLRNLTRIIHEIICLPRAKDFVKYLLNILAMAENREEKDSEKVSLEGEEIEKSGSAYEQSHRWRKLDAQQQRGLKKLRRSPKVEPGADLDLEINNSLETGVTNIETPNTTTPIPRTNPQPQPSVTVVNPKSVLSSTNASFFLNDEIKSTGITPVSTDIWEMNKPIMGQFPSKLSDSLVNKSFGQRFNKTPVADFDKTTNQTLTAGKTQEKIKKKKVPYAEHQIIFPSNFFKYPVRELSTGSDLDKFTNSVPTVLPNWFNIQLVPSIPSIKASLESVELSLDSVLLILNSNGYYYPLLETIICQNYFRNFILHCKSFKVESYNNYVNLIQKNFPTFTSLPEINEILDDSFNIFEENLKATTAENYFNELPIKVRNHCWDSKRYQDFIEKFIYFRTDAAKLNQICLGIKQDMFFSSHFNLINSINHIERLLVSHIGHIDNNIRELSVIYLNSLYDTHPWQINQPFFPKIRSIGDYLSIEFDKEFLPGELKDSLFICLSLPLSIKRNSNNKFANKLFIKPKLYKNSYLVEISTFEKAGYYDWALVSMDRDGIELKYYNNHSNHHSNHPTPTPHHHHPSPLNQSTSSAITSHIESFGRFIVHPQIRQDIFHEVFVDIEGATWDRVHGGPVQRRGTFSNISKALDDYHTNDGITVIHVMGSLERAEFGTGRPFSPIDRATPNKASGGIEQFTEFIKAAKEKGGMKVLVDATTRISIKGAHRKYRNLNCYQLDKNGMLQVTIGTDGAEQVWDDCQLLNYRKKRNWDLFIEDIIEWAKLGVNGIRIESSHCCPVVLKPDTKELERMDSDGKFHYELQEIIDGDIVLPFTNEAYTYGYYGTSAYTNGYPNPFFIKTTKSIWNEFPEFIFTAETYWDRQLNSVSSGLIPYSTGLPQALTSVFGTGLRKDGTVGRLAKKSDVKVFYDWYEMERTRYPQNAIVIYPSCNHYSPYPVSLYGRGAWSAVDLAFFLPEIPATFVGEHGGWSMEYDALSNSFRKLALDNQTSTLSEIRGHYVHRAKLRTDISVLHDGGMILLYAKVNQKTWHDRVFAFARFKFQKMAIIAINFNDVESTFYIDFTPLKCLFGDQSGIYKRVDEIDPSPDKVVYFSLEELLNETQQVTLQPYKSLCWGIYVETQSSIERVLFEHSFRRLTANLQMGIDPVHNLVYSDICKAFNQSIDEFGSFIESFTEQLPPVVFQQHPRVLHDALTFYATTTKKESKLLGTLEFLKQRKHEKLVEQGIQSIHRDYFNIFEQLLNQNKLGPLVFVTPEIGRFSKVGGIAVMVDELTRALVLLGCEVIVISPYYNFDRKGQTGYLKEEGVTWLKNITTYVGNERIDVGIHELKEHGITYYFIHHFDFFPTPYHAGSAIHQLKTIVLMAKAALELCCQIRLLPAVIITNDWFTGLVPAYGRKSSAFGATFQGTTFFHLVHNLEEGYEGKIYLDGYDDLGYIHHLPRDIVVDPSSVQLCLNASRCALLSCNQWGTVSKSYCQDLMEGLNPSPLRHYLVRFPRPFAHSNGIQVQERLKQITSIAAGYADAKKKLQIKYFGAENEAIPLLSFVGRICLQKGVHLILNAVRELVDKYSGRVQIIVGGMANYKDPYAAQCAWTMQGLRSSFPDNFWADPNEFFNDGPLLNLGSDFALMPSLFEPSGVVQQEYFLAGTPVIAFKTGGLKDTVFEGTTGNGFTFEGYTHRDFVDAISRAISVYADKKRYQKLRENAKASVLDMRVVAQAWATEFSRLRNCIWADIDQVNSYVELLNSQFNKSTSSDAPSDAPSGASPVPQDESEEQLAPSAAN